MKLTMVESLVLFVLLCSTNKASSTAKENVKNMLEKHNEECAIIAHSHCLVFMTSFNCDMSSTIQALHYRPSWLHIQLCNIHIAYILIIIKMFNECNFLVHVRLNIYGGTSIGVYRCLINCGANGNFGFSNALIC